MITAEPTFTYTPPPFSPATSEQNSRKTEEPVRELDELVRRDGFGNEGDGHGSWFSLVCLNFTY
jgi:hypothetical protein